MPYKFKMVLKKRAKTYCLNAIPLIKKSHQINLKNCYQLLQIVKNR